MPTKGQKFYHRCEIIISSSEVTDQLINYAVEVNGELIYGVIAVTGDEIHPAELTKQMLAFETALYGPVRAAARKAFRSAASKKFLSEMSGKAGKFRGEMTVNFPDLVGRPKKSRNRQVKYSRSKLERYVSDFYLREGEAPTLPQAAQHLGYSSARTLRAARTRHGEADSWPVFTQKIIAAVKRK